MLKNTIKDSFNSYKSTKSIIYIKNMYDNYKMLYRVSLRHAKANFYRDKIENAANSIKQQYKARKKG